MTRVYADYEVRALLETAHHALQAAAADVCTPVEDRLIDAMLAILAHLGRTPGSLQPKEPERESDLIDPKAIAERHGVDVGLLCERIDAVKHDGGIHLSERESLFLRDLLAALGFE